MKLLVTGGAGFIGSAVVRLAIARGHAVTNVDALTYAACLDNVASVSSSPLNDLSSPPFETGRSSSRSAIASRRSIQAGSSCCFGTGPVPGLRATGSPA